MARQLIDLEIQTNWGSKEIPLNKLSQSSASVGQIPAWNGVEWVPVTVVGGVLPDNFSRAEVLTYTAVLHKVLGLLATPPVVSEVMLHPIGGPVQRIVVDFTVRQVIGGTEPGYYVCIAPTSSAPGGGTFLSGANPTIGLEAEMFSGDEVLVVYATWPIP